MKTSFIGFALGLSFRIVFALIDISNVPFIVALPLGI